MKGFVWTLNSLRPFHAHLLAISCSQTSATVIAGSLSVRHNTSKALCKKVIGSSTAVLGRHDAWSGERLTVDAARENAATGW
jgi:hypothetical protein